jgi:hypothetical protein
MVSHSDKKGRLVSRERGGHLVEWAGRLTDFASIASAASFVNSSFDKGANVLPDIV